MRFAVLVSAMLALLVSANAAAMQLSLKAEALVKGPRLLLGDLISFEGEKREVHAMATLDLGSAPLPGYSDRYTRKELERKIRSRGHHAALNWNGAEAIRVERAGRAFDVSEVARTAEIYLREHMNGAADRLEIQTQQPHAAELELPDGQLELKPRPLPNVQIARRNLTVWVDLIVDGVFVRSVAIPFTLQVYRSVLVAKRDMPKDTVPQCDAFQVQEVDVAALAGAPLSVDCQAIQGRLRYALAHGSPLLKSDLHLGPAHTFFRLALLAEPAAGCRRLGCGRRQLR
jgi:flagella basal body P-ring formation protein FlgA